MADSLADSLGQTVSQTVSLLPNCKSNNYAQFLAKTDRLTVFMKFIKSVAVKGLIHRPIMVKIDKPHRKSVVFECKIRRKSVVLWCDFNRKSVCCISSNYIHIYPGYGTTLRFSEKLTRRYRIQEIELLLFAQTTNFFFLLS